MFRKAFCTNSSKRSGKCTLELVSSRCEIHTHGMLREQDLQRPYLAAHESASIHMLMNRHLH